MPGYARHTLAALVLSVSALVPAACKYATVGDTPGADESVSGTTGKKISSTAGPTRSAGWAEYSDSEYGFRVEHPADFVVSPRDVAGLAQFKPTPVVSIFFMNPTMAAGDLAGIEPPDLEVRVYRSGAEGSLKSWLESAGFAGAESGALEELYRGAGIEGLKLCQSTMVAPGCSVFFLHGDYVYQFTPASVEGEAMMETFALLR